MVRNMLIIMDMMNILIKNGRIIDPANKIDKIADLLIVDGKIAKIGMSNEVEDTQIIDATDLIVTPGLFDMHVHLREPGYEYKEDIESGTSAASHGGFSSVACMANTNPVADNRTVLEKILESAKDGHANLFPIGSITKRLAGKALTDFAGLIDAGAVALSDDGKTVMNVELMRKALEISSELKIPIIDHCEDSSLSQDGVINRGVVSQKLNLPGIPNSAESTIVERDIELAEATNGHIHIAHVSTAESVKLIRDAKQRNIKITAEATPHHFSLTEEAVEKYGTNAKMNPPLRTQDDVDAVIEGLQDEMIDVIATDHAPHTAEEKSQGLIDAPFGIIGLETCVPLVFSKLVEPGHLSISQAIAKLTCNPASVLKINIGTLSIGTEADVTLIDTEKVARVDAKKFRSKSSNTPFDGWELHGWPFMTIRKGIITNHTRKRC